MAGGPIGLEEFGEVHDNEGSSSADGAHLCQVAGVDPEDPNTVGTRTDGTKFALPGVDSLNVSTRSPAPACKALDSLWPLCVVRSSGLRGFLRGELGLTGTAGSAQLVNQRACIAGRGQVTAHPHQQQCLPRRPPGDSCPHGRPHHLEGFIEDCVYCEYLLLDSLL